MPFKSRAQMKYMFAKLPKIAKRWEDKYGVPKNLPKHVKKSKAKSKVKAKKRK